MGRDNLITWLMENKWLIVFLISIPSLLLLTVYFFSPLLDGIVLGIVFAYVVRPLKKRIEKFRYFGRIISSAIATLIIMVPIGIILTLGVIEGLNQIVWLVTHQSDIEMAIASILGQFGIPEDVQVKLGGFLPAIFHYLQTFAIRFTTFESTVRILLFLLNLLISGFICFYLLADGDRFFLSLLNMLPEKNRETVNRFFIQADEILSGLWVGNFLVAMLIAFASIPFFILFDIPFISLLVGLMFLAALIPIFAEWMIIIPVSLYLIYVRDLHTGILFLGITAVGLYILPELILRPYFLSYTSQVHPVLLMLAFIGGGITGGIAGFFLAPMAVALLTAIYKMYHGDYS